MSIVNYPDFELISSGADEEELPAARDFYLIYSICLHYGCVTCLDKCFQRTTQSLAASEQLAVTVFLNYFLSQSINVTRPTLAAAIAEAVQSMDSGPLGKLYAQDENGNRADLLVTYSTPKTIRLEQNFREISRLRGQVDNTDYEVSHLESLLREKDIKIANMKQREMDLEREMEEMKRKHLYTAYTYDSDDQRLVAEELIRKERTELRTLRRNNSMLEDRVSNLLIEVDNLNNDKEKLIMKLKGGSKEIRGYRDREAELAELIEELNVDLAAKSRRIGELLEVNMELESYISENKSLWNKNIDTMNSSTMSAFSNISDSLNGSLTNPQRSSNLASCVIDLQLKEKEAENAELKQKLTTLHDKSHEMQQGIEKFLEENKVVREKCRGGPSCNATESGWFEKIPEFLQALTEVLRDKAQLETQIQGQSNVLARFRAERERLKEELGKQAEKCAGMEKELVGLRETVKAYAETERKDLDTFKFEVKQLNDLMTIQKLEKESFKSAIEKGEEDVYAKIRKINKLNLVIEKLRFEKKKLENEHKEAEVTLNKRWELKVAEVERRQQELEKSLAAREKQLVEVAEAKDEMTRKNEEVEKREQRQRKELIRVNDLVLALEKDVVELRMDKANLEARVQLMSKNTAKMLSIGSSVRNRFMLWL